MSLVGAAALRLVRPHIDGAHTLRRGFVTACTVAAAGVAGRAVAPEANSGSLAVLLAAGALPLTAPSTPSGSTNRPSAPSGLRFTRCSQPKYLGEIACGLAIAVVAHLATMHLALLISGGLLAIAALLIQHIDSPRPEPAP